MIRTTAKGIVLLAAALVSVVAINYSYRKYVSDRRGYEAAGESYDCRGIDVSAHNGDIDFEKVAADGIDFIIIKATEGTDFRDRMFADNVRKARRAGLRVGAYHFFRFDTDGPLQALNLIDAIRHRELDFPVVVDVEEWGNPDGNTTRDIVERLRAMLDVLDANGIDVMLYTDRDAYNRYVRGNFDSLPIWLCSLMELLDDEPIDWSMWQYSHTGHVDGIIGDVDMNTIKPGRLR